MTPDSYPAIDFHQYGSTSDDDRLIVFAAKAKDIAAWAGIPRKGWRIRMLFQRWITPGREQELAKFWSRAAKPRHEDGETYVLGPTAIVVAMNRPPEIVDGRICLKYTSSIEGIVDPCEKLMTLAGTVLPVVKKRLSESAESLLATFMQNPLVEDLPDIGHDYVLEFALQLSQMAADGRWFVNHHRIPPVDLAELIVSMEALCRPAVVVDGQHRLHGAQAVEADVYLPVVAIAKADWVTQIYQFVVINEKAQKVDGELLNDIFASSLTPEEQDSMRRGFVRVKVDIEQRIAGVLAGRRQESPFYQMVTLGLPNPPAAEANAYISQTIIQSLIEGGRGTWGWRSEDRFYDVFVKPTFPEREQWDSWSGGLWRDYWFAFWKTVREYYRPRAKRIKGNDFDIWSPKEQSNLTKGVGLKVFQRFYMETMVEKVNSERQALQVLKEVLPAAEAEEKIRSKLAENAIAPDIDTFVTRLQSDFLEKFPVRFFTGKWESSLDDAEGQAKLLFEMREAFTRDNWRARGGVFVPDNGNDRRGTESAD